MQTEIHFLMFDTYLIKNDKIKYKFFSINKLIFYMSLLIKYSLKAESAFL